MSLSVLIIEPRLYNRLELKKNVNRHSGFGRCVAASTLAEGAARVRSDSVFDAFMISTCLDVDFISSFVEMNRRERVRKGANLLVMSSEVRVVPRELRKIKADGVVLEPKSPEDLNATHAFLEEFKRKSLEEGRTVVQRDMQLHMRKLCAQASLAIDARSTEHLRTFKTMLSELDDEQAESFMKAVVDYFSELVQSSDGADMP